MLRQGATVKDVCLGVHKSLAEDFKAGIVWGTSTKHSPQRVALHHQVNDEDVVMIMKK